jgi:hypothetical protein
MEVRELDVRREFRVPVKIDHRILVAIQQRIRPTCCVNPPRELFNARTDDSISHAYENVRSTRPVQLYGVTAIELKHAFSGWVIAVDLNPAVGEAGQS